MIGALVVLRRQPEPSYAGRALSDWADQYVNAHTRRALAFVRPGNLAPAGIDAESEAALRAIGTNAFPFVLKWSHFEQNHSLAKLFYSLRLNRLPRPLRNGLHRIAFRELGQKHAQEAVYIVRILGPEARPLAPLLLRLGQDPAEPDTAYRVFAALGSLGTNGLPELMQVLGNPSHPYRGVAVEQVEQVLRDNSASGVPASVLLQCLRDHDSSLVVLASQLLCQAGADPAGTVPALQTNLLSPDPSIRLAASNALFLLEATRQGAPAQLHP